jgi:hypothetical protein
MPIAIGLAPWIHVARSPVEVRMRAPLDVRAEVSWEIGSPHYLPLVPILDPDGKTASSWVAELPARPVYHIAIHFQTPLRNVLFRRITLIDTRHADVPIYDRKWADAPPWIAGKGIMATADNRELVLDSDTGGRLVDLDEISLEPVVLWWPVLEIWLGLISIVALAALLILPLFQRPDPQNMAPQWPKGSKWIWIAFAVAMVIHISLILHALVVIAGGDTGIYLLQGLDLAQHGAYRAGGMEFELNRLPGYPLLICIMLLIGGGYHLTHIAIAQGVLFCVSVLLFAISMRRWLRPMVAAGAIFVAILSPAQVWASRSILTESSFGSFCLLAIAALFAHIASGQRKSKIWLAAFACLATCAVFIRPNGIALYAALLPVCGPGLVAIFRRTSQVAEKIRSAMAFVFPYVASGLALLFAIGAWSLRNYIEIGYGRASDMTGVTILCGLIGSGAFELTALQDSGIYDQYLRDMRHQGYYEPGFLVRHTVFVQITDNGAMKNRDTLPRLDETLLRISADSKRISPWQVGTIALLRSAWWAVWWPDVTDYTLAGIRLDYADFGNNSATIAGGHYLGLKEIETKYFPQWSTRLVYDWRQPNWVYSLYEPFAQLYYNGWYVGLSLLGLWGAIYCILRRRVELAIPMYVFVANILINVYLLNVFSRYIHILDGVLVFQFALGISLFLARRRAARN